MPADDFIECYSNCKTPNPCIECNKYLKFGAMYQKAKELGYQIKVETRGSGGAKNVLTEDEIAKAAGVIVACDTKVPTDRFDGKKVIECRYLME